MGRATRRVLLAGRIAKERRERRAGYNLRVFTISSKTKEWYDKAVGAILPFLEKQEGLTFLDDVVCEWMELQWGRGESANFIADTLSGLHHHWPQVRGSFKQAWRLFRQWRKAEAPCRAPPLTPLAGSSNCPPSRAKGTTHLCVFSGHWIPRLVAYRRNISTSLL